MDETNIKINKKKAFRIWWSIIRPESLTVSIIPVFVGTTLSIADGVFRAWISLAMLIASVLIHIAANIFNEYYDFKRGLDNEQSVGTGGALVRGDINPKSAVRMALTFFFIALLLGIYISFESSWWVALVGGISMLIGYLYTGGPLPIAYTPLGELISGIFMGTIIICISYFAQAQTLTNDVIYISIPVALFVSGIMLTNNIRDLDGDKENGRKTLAILLGRKKAIRLLAFLFILAYALTGLYIVNGMLPLLSIIVFITAFGAYNVIKKLQGKSQPAEMAPAMAVVGKTHAMYGFVLGLSILVNTFI